MICEDSEAACRIACGDWGDGGVGGLFELEEELSRLWLKGLSFIVAMF